MAEIAREVAALRQAGAQSVILLGHSMGTAAAISYAALKGDVEGIVLTAPGHVPITYQQMDFMRDALATAKRMVAAGQGGEIAVFADSNQGQRLSPRMKAADYVSWFDPDGDAEMSRMAAKVRPRTAALLIVGDQDRIVSVARATIFDRLPPDPRNAYVQIRANHVQTLTEGAPHFLAWLKARAHDAE
jgi:pimeloyl-ACP methyl ester carboxylesterase